MIQRLPSRRLVRLVHWQPAEARQQISLLRKSGYTVDASPVTPESLKTLTHRKGLAVVIDLSRLPSQGRDVGVLLRHRRITRHIPIVFVGGEHGSDAQIRTLIPDAHFTPWRLIRSALRTAIARPPLRPRIPVSTLEGYAGTPLVNKLGIRHGSPVDIRNGPPGFSRRFGGLLKAARRQSSDKHVAGLTIAFVRSRVELGHELRRYLNAGAPGSVWFAWPKRTSGIASDLSQERVRAAGLAAGLVDYKVCAIDDVWSGLKFVRRKKRAGKRRGASRTTDT